MATKTFKTLFELAAKYTGGPAFGKLNKDIDKTQRNVKQTANVFARTFGKAGSMVAALGATAAAYVSFRKAVDIGKWAFDAAKEQKKAHDIVRQSNQRLIKEGRLRADELDKETKATIALAEAMNKAGGLDAETLEVGLAGLNKFLDSGQIEKMAKGWQDWMVKIHKGAPTTEQAAQDVDNLNKYILSGKKAFLTSIGLTKEQSDAIAKQVKGHTANERAQSRAAAVARILGKETGETARWMETDAGKAYLAENALQDLGETIGGPLVKAQREMNIALTDLYKALGPVAELIAKEMSPAVQNLTKWLSENKGNIVKWGETAVQWTSKVVNFFWWLQAQSESALKPVWENSMKELNALIGVWENVKLGATAAWNGIKEIWDTAAPYFASIVEAIGKAFIPLYNLLIKPFVDAYNYVMKLFPGSGGAAAAPTPYSGGARQEGDYVPEWQQTESGSGGPTGYPLGSSITQNASLEEARAKLAEEVKNDPQARALLYSKVKAEVGNQGFDAIQKQMETMYNRAYLRGLTIKEVASQGGKAGRYWGSGYKHLSADEQKVYDLAAAGVHAGSAKARSATGNESAWLRNGRVVATAKGERFVEEPADARKIQKLRNLVDKPEPTANVSRPGPQGDRQTGGTGERTQSLMEGAMIHQPGGEGSKLRNMIKGIDPRQRTEGISGGQSVAMNSPITINGVPTGRETAVARAVNKAMRMSTKEFTDVYKKSRSDDLRLGYV